MVKFSCFFIPNQRSKKIRQVGVTMHTSPEKKTQDGENKVVSGSPSTNPRTNKNNLPSNGVENITSPSSHEDGWDLENLSINSDPEGNEELQMRMHMKKSQSFGSIFHEEEYSGGDVIDDDEIDGGFSFNDSHQKSMMRMNGSLNDITSTELIDSFDMIPENPHHESLFSIEALRQFDGDQHADEQSPDHEPNSGFLSSDIPPAFERSQSVDNLRVEPASPREDSMTHEVMVPRSRSFQILPSANGRMAEFPDRDDVLRSGVHLHREGFNSDNKSTDGYDFHNSNAVVNVGRKLETDYVKLKKIQQESPILSFDELDPKELSIRRIQDWIGQIDIENGCVEEPGESSSASFSTKEPQVESDVPTTKPDAKSHIGMEVAYNYMKSLTATSSAAQMPNLGLVAVPFLSAFVGLRVLNLSGNAIGRITVGALPRGLHMLNLSKNNIAVIEGLRDLTRLRVLDLSYNRILKIGHGLGFCSSLKELYLAGNKISEVEGLHRLLKLNVLDLCSNKISTAKGLGQLAANYGSLQAVNLDGNPAQRNVGDEQLKKYLLGLLPNLGYYNKQAIRTSSTKEISDRPPRTFARAEHKLTRKGSHGSGLHKLPLNPARPNHPVGSSSKPARVRNAEFRHLHLLPVGGPKLSYRMPEADKKPVSLQPNNAIR